MCLLLFRLRSFGFMSTNLKDMYLVLYFSFFQFNFCFESEWKGGGREERTKHKKSSFFLLFLSESEFLTPNISLSTIYHRWPMPKHFTPYPPPVFHTIHPFRLHDIPSNNLIWWPSRHSLKYSHYLVSPTMQNKASHVIEYRTFHKVIFSTTFSSVLKCQTRWPTTLPHQPQSLVMSLVT